MEVAPGIMLIDHVRGANSYLVTTGEGAAVIDTGMPGNEERIVEFSKGAGVEPGNLRYIILTHPDIDHSGSAARLRSLTNAKLAIHEADAPRLSGEKKLKEVKGGMGVVFGLMAPLMRFTPVKADLLLKDADRVLDLTVIHTPGHTDGSISLYRENEAIFVGDAMRTDSEGKPHLPSGSMTANMAQAKESVKKISEYHYSVLLPGHGPPMTREASKVLADYVQRGFAEQ
jgi:glyoxylase-like metal-dependent hydrolase (beta-lactamase superfamily II)